MGKDDLRGVKFDKYLLVRKKKGSGSVVLNAYYYNLKMEDCSRIIFDGITFTGGGIGVYLQHCDHMIFINCEITNQKLGGFQIQKDSSYIDIVNCKIWNTGLTEPKWGEGIYVGTPGLYDSDKDGIKDKYDHTKRIWIENCEIYSCGNGEAINLKGDVEESTIRGCYIHDLSPGTADQANDGGVSLESPMDISKMNRRNNFVENCTIFNIKEGFDGTTNEGYKVDYNNGLAIYGSGNTFQNNKISGCSNFGIFGNGYKNQSSLMNYLFGNEISNCGIKEKIDDDIAISRTSNPNPFKNQLEMP
jgi:hypothetical protein